MDGCYGEPPVDLGPLDLPDWQEFMHWLYLPVRIPEPGAHTRTFYVDCVLPGNLAFIRPAVRAAIEDARRTAPHLREPYVYVTARRGFATPGNPLNRPGWHCDDFGGTDLNYIWCDRFPTRFLIDQREGEHAGVPVSEDDQQSMRDMDFWARQAELAASLGRMHACRIEEMPVGHLMRLTPYVIHDTPLIPEPGGMRSFFKISVSTHRYNLLGNSHNHLLDYDWPMYDRAEVRNRPQGGNSDYYEPVETPEDSAALVDANLRAKGGRGLD